MTENEKGTKPHRRIGLSGRRQPGPVERGGRERLAGQADQTKAPSLGSASRGREMAPRADARCHGPHLRLPGGLALLPPRPEPGPLLRLTIPSSAHELVQQGPHLRLGGHGGQWGRPRSPAKLNKRSRKPSLDYLDHIWC